MHHLNKLSLTGLSIAGISFLAGVLAMFAAKIAAWQGGIFLSRTELHWFNDSITAFLLAIALIGFVIAFQLIKEKK